MAEAAAAKKPTTADAQSERPRFSLTMDRFKLKEHRNPGYAIDVPETVTIDDLLSPDFWANWAKIMRRSSTIEVHWDDSSQIAELYVIDLGRNWASVALKSHTRLERPASPKGRRDQFDIGWHGGTDMFRITNRTNGTLLQAGFATESDARRFLDEHIKKLG